MNTPIIKPPTRAQLQAQVQWLEAEVARLRKALEPFARRVQSISLSGALGHILREDLWRARDALQEKKDAPET